MFINRYPLIIPYPRYSVTYTAQSPSDAANANAGQLTMPTSRTSAPDDVSPATRAAFIMELLLMRSVPTTTLRWSMARACPRSIPISGPVSSAGDDLSRILLACAMLRSIPHGLILVVVALPGRSARTGPYRVIVATRKGGF